MPRDPARRLTELQKIAGYRFRDEGLLQQALVHRSLVNENRDAAAGDNERLEFLGDAVLQLVVSDYLFEHYTGQDEGDLSKKRSALVREESLAAAAENLKIGRYLCLGKGEEGTGGRGKASILAGALEALIGAVYLDGGYAAAQELILVWLGKLLTEAVEEEIYHSDHKSRLQELCQARFHRSPEYLVISESGPDHHKLFEVGVRLEGELRGSGRGRSKKEAEQQAARDALVGLELSTDRRKA